MSNKVVVTGLGAVSPVGSNVESLWSACLNNESNVELIPEKWNNYSDYKSGIWAPLPDIDFKSEGFSRIEVMQRDPASMIAIMATSQALMHAGINVSSANDRNRQFILEGVDAERAGVFMGTGSGGVKTLLETHAHQILNNTFKQMTEADIKFPLLEEHDYPKRYNPFVVSMFVSNTIPSSIGIKYSIHGINRAISQACASATAAIGEAYQAIKSGQLDFVVCGGSEYLYDDYGSIYRGFDLARTLAIPDGDIEKANRPFDEDRTGFLYAQGGAGILILESESHAKKRGANILAQVSGYGETFDAYSMMSLNPDGYDIKRMIKLALNDAKLKSCDIDYINAHGTGTVINDKVETNVIEEIFGTKPIINSSKSIIGHSLAASGALEAIISVLSLQNQTAHRCNNLENPIRELNFVTTLKTQNIRHVLSESFAFGGHNSALILSEPKI